MDVKAEVLDQHHIRIAQLEEELAKKDALLKWYMEQYRLWAHRKYGASREKALPSHQPGELLMLFNEVEATANPNAQEPAIGHEVTPQEQAKPERKPRIKPKGKREADIKGLPINKVEYRIPQDKQVCGNCNSPLHEMSTQTRREVVIIPAKVEIVEHVQVIYGCRECENTGIKATIVNAPMPPAVIPGSIASPSIIASVIEQKYVMGLPLYRQEQLFERLGIPISRQNMANWVITVAQNWIEPLYDRLHSILLLQNILFADETVFQVLHEPEKKATTKSFCWLYRTGREGPSIIIYDYKPNRAGENPRRFLEGFSGFLHVDCYQGYEKLPQDKVTLVACWAHSRRYFWDALKALPADENKEETAAYKGLEFCDRLFEIERKYKESTPDERFVGRQAESRPILDSFWTWLHDASLKQLPKSAVGKAIGYCLKNWDKLSNFMLDGRLELDNNRSERSIKKFVIGRKNWLFANTPRGAKASAILYSIVETAIENGLNPRAYVEFLLETLPNINLKDQNALDNLLPWSAILPDKCFSPSK